MAEMLILVDKNDWQVGTEEKIRAHEQAKLHRAFSIYVFNSKGQLLLQKRAKSKYHSGGLWTNTCCSHPRVEESVEYAAHRRLVEEMGFDCNFREVTEFIYKVPLDKGLTEHEYLHVFAGKYDAEPKLNPEEAEAYKWVDPELLMKEVKEHPDNYTEWFKITLARPEFKKVLQSRGV